METKFKSVSLFLSSFNRIFSISWSKPFLIAWSASALFVTLSLFFNSILLTLNKFFSEKRVSVLKKTN